MVTLNEDYVLKKIIKTGRLAEKLGAKILGLGAFTAVVGDCRYYCCKGTKYPGYNREQLYGCNCFRGYEKRLQRLWI